MNYRFPAFLAVFTVSWLMGFAQKNLVFCDKVYEPQIKTVQLYPSRGGQQDYQLPAVAPLGPSVLVLEFDDLQGNRSNYYVKLIHCNYDWVKSNLMDLDYLNDYNEYPINDYSGSGGTQTTYIHYRFQVPDVKVAGNYLLIVYRDDPSNLIISRRFMIFSKMVNLNQDNQLAGTGALSFTTQPLNFAIDYTGVDILNPMESVHVVMRQNQRWDNAKTDLKPSFLRDADNQLEYHFFDQDKFFAGGNEFRFVDFRSLSHPGQNTGKVNRQVKPLEIAVQQDAPRIDQAYAQYSDLDGNYQIDNQDSGEPITNSNYVNVKFTLNTPAPLTDPVYVIGAFNAWDRTAENAMKYAADRAVYEATILLKQGLYNYQYVVDSKTIPANYFEGNHFETENLYEIFVYNHEFERNSDTLIGYFPINLNAR